MKKSPKVSVIIPCYNCKKYVIEALNSIFLQEYDNLEIIVVDDGSIDGSDHYIENDSNSVQVVRQKNQGPAAATTLSVAPHC